MGAVVTNFSEFSFKIDGKVNGAEMTPLTIPMARLALYLLDLAQLLGYRESVHLLSVEEGSTQPRIFIDADEEVRVMARVRNAQRGMGPLEANRAYQKIDHKLRQDDAIASFVNVTQGAEVIEFPGVRANLPHAYGPIRERASITGTLMRVGGFDKTVPVHLQRADGLVYYCDAEPMIAQQLAPLYRKTVRIHGIATYKRGKEGVWTLEYFKIQSFDPEPLSDETFSQTIAKLKAVSGTAWNEIADPLEELRRIRGGEENTAP